MRHPASHIARGHILPVHLDALLGHASHRLSVNTYGVSNDDLWPFGDTAFWQMGTIISLVWHKGVAIAQGMPCSATVLASCVLGVPHSRRPETSVADRTTRTRRRAMLMLDRDGATASPHLSPV
jgi:hypothetical protein